MSTKVEHLPFCSIVLFPNLTCVGWSALHFVSLSDLCMHKVVNFSFLVVQVDCSVLSYRMQCGQGSL